MNKGIDPVNFGCELGCYGTGFVLVIKGEKIEEAKCAACQAWRQFEEKALRIKSLDFYLKRGWKIYYG